MIQQSKLLCIITWLLFLAVHFLEVHPYTLPKACQNVSVTEREVYNKYFAHEEPWQRPVKTGQDAVNVTVRLVLFGINDISEREGIVHLTGHLNIKWHDQVHIWNETMPYACCYSIHLGTDKTWIPEVALLNSEKKYAVVQSEGVEKVRIFSNGSTSYRPGGTFAAYCQFEITFLPFDTQVCTLEFESWRYVKEVQKLTFADPPISTRYWRENEQWSLVGGRISRSTQNYLSDANYEHLTFELTFKRKTGYYWLNVIIPSLIISLAQLSVFTLPIEEVIKVHVSFTCLLAYGVFQLMIIEDMPRSSDHIPLLSIYIDLSMGYIFFAICGLGLTFVCLRISGDKIRKKYVPAVLLFLAHIIGTFIGVAYPHSLELKEEEPDDDRVGLTGFHFAQSGQIFSTVFDSILKLNETLQHPDNRGNNESNGALIDFENDPLLAGLGGEGLAAKKAKVEQKKAAGVKKVKKPKHQIEWEFLACVIDRFTTLSYVTMAVGTPIIMFAIVPAGQKVKHDVNIIVYT